MLPTITAFNDPIFYKLRNIHVILLQVHEMSVTGNIAVRKFNPIGRASSLPQELNDAVIIRNMHTRFPS
jgi:hypothetical protein